MEIRLRYKNGKDELLIESETDDEADLVRDFARHLDTVTGTIHDNRVYKHPLIILRKDE